MQQCHGEGSRQTLAHALLVRYSPQGRETRCSLAHHYRHLVPNTCTVWSANEHFVDQGSITQEQKSTF